MLRKMPILVLALIMTCTTAFAVDFEIFVSVYEILEEQHITFPESGGSAKKNNDGDKYFYLTPTGSNLPSGRKVYFRSMYSRSTSSSAIASNYVTVTKSTTTRQKATYLSGKAKGGHTYYLAAAGKAIQDDPFLGNSFKIIGRWTP